MKALENNWRKYCKVSSSRSGIIWIQIKLKLFFKIINVFVQKKLKEVSTPYFINLAGL